MGNKNRSYLLIIGEVDKIKIRKAEKKDTAILKNLLWESLKEEWKFNSDIDLKSGKIFLNKNLRMLFKNKKEHTKFLAEENGKIVGFIGGNIEKKNKFYKTRRIGAIYDLFVEEKYRGKGIGTKLIKKFILWLKANKIKLIELDVSPKNKTAIKLYERLGFKESSIQLRKKI